MKNNSGLKQLQLSVLSFLSWAYFLISGGGLLLILFQAAQKVGIDPIFKLWRSWSDFKCCWECLGSRLAAFLVERSVWIIILGFLSFSFFQALLKMLVRLKETSAFARRLKSRASPRKSWGIDYFVFPLGLPFALTSGWIRPKIFVSSVLLKTLSQDELKTVLLHEVFHQKRRDPLKNLFLSFLADLTFFLPETNRLRKAFGLARELRADFYCLEKGQKLSSLINSLEKIHNFQFSPQLKFSGYLAEFSDLERLRYLCGGRLKLNLSWRQAVGSFLAVILCFFLAFSPILKNGKNIILDHKSVCSLHFHNQEDRQP